MIDANDNGRELQLAIYDPTRAAQGCAHNASCPASTACPGGLTHMGWDPVQGGDECGHGGKVLSHGQKGDALELVVQPMQWNPDWDQPSCVENPCPVAGRPVAVTYTFQLRYLTEHVVEVMSQVASQETIDHPSTEQEFPTLYVNHGNGGPDLELLLDAAGQAVTIATPANDGFFVGNFDSPAPWVTWQRSGQTYGVGLAMDQGIKAFQGWRGDQTRTYFHNVRARISFGLGAGRTVRGLSYLALGDFATVKNELDGVFARRPPFGTLDVPAAGDTPYAPGQPLRVAGWALDSATLGPVEVSVDGAVVATLPLTSVRPDVCAVYPGYAGCPAVGFSGPVTIAATGPCPHLLRVTARDAQGNATVLGERRLVVSLPKQPVE
ncbi:MAG: hypothetical protein IPG96_19850 [Proteobacteria bacterium]|nr:hypothetical protein [Pseudomonadota bacterium]